MSSMKGKIMYPETLGLLSSMAMRYRHDFGLMEDEQREEMIVKMKQLYELYNANLSNEEIAEKTKYDLVSICQLREEVEGKGFFIPPEERARKEIEKQEIIQRLEALKSESIYPLTKELLISMAVRCDHAFGMLSTTEQASLIIRMKSLYKLYASGLTNKEIAKQSSKDIGSINQIREEVEGEGFFSPENAQYYHTFIKPADFEKIELN
jgi:Mor family transcriptional regulator